jgi:hypothetical protein
VSITALPISSDCTSSNALRIVDARCFTVVMLTGPDEVRRLRLRGTDVDARAAVGRFR